MRMFMLASCLLAPALSLSAQSPLTTTYGNNNGGGVGGAVYFDLNAAIPLSITGIDINLSTAASTTGSIDIYTCATTYVGNEANASAWTLIGSGSVTSNGAGTASTLTLAAPIAILSGAAGYAYVGVGHSFAYTNGTGSNQTYSTAELTLTAGAAGNVAFSGTPFTPRVVNTTISYVAAGGNFATATPFGEGCYDAPRMVYEQFPVNTPVIDLVNTQQTLIYASNANGGSYVIINGGTAYDGVTPATNGVDLLASGFTSSSSANWDDASVVITLPTASFPNGFPFPGPGGGSCTDITVNSNGKVMLGNTTDASFATNGANYGAIGPFQGTSGAALPTLSPFNVDLDPTVGGSIWYEAASPSGGVRITWAGVPNWPAVPGVVCDIQIEMLPGGLVNFAYGAGLANGGTSQNDAIVGFSAGNAEPVSPMVDWSTLNGYQSGDGSVPLAISNDARPVIGTTINLTIDNIPPGAPLAAVIYGLAKFDPGIQLSGIGMDGCLQYCSQDSVALIIAPTSSSSSPFPIPNDPSLSAVTITVQGGAFAPGTVPNVLGATSSNGIELVVDVN